MRLLKVGHLLRRINGRSGIAQRSNDEERKGEKAKLSYESFVESLDEQDLFTTTLIEILVKVRWIQLLSVCILTDLIAGAGGSSQPPKYRRSLPHLSSHSYVPQIAWFEVRRVLPSEAVAIRSAPQQVQPCSWYDGL